jgi:hypothetical protein
MHVSLTRSPVARFDSDPALSGVDRPWVPDFCMPQPENVKTWHAATSDATHQHMKELVFTKLYPTLESTQKVHSMLQSSLYQCRILRRLQGCGIARCGTTHLNKLFRRHTVADHHDQASKRRHKWSGPTVKLGQVRCSAGIPHN